jgi:uncharacterized membrane protein HdeD (DUF308 family)
VSVRVHPGLAWVGVVAAPLAWVFQLIAAYAFQEAGCAPGSGTPVFDADTEPWIAAVSVVAITAAVVGIAASVVTLRAATKDREADPRGRVAFMGDVGLLVSVIFLAVIVLGTVALPSLDACHPA